MAEFFSHTPVIIFVGMTALFSLTLLFASTTDARHQ